MMAINLQEKEGHDEPGNEVDAKSTGKFSNICECSKNATAWEEDGSIGHPECTIGCES